MTLGNLKGGVDKPRNKQAGGKKVGEVAGVCVPALGRLWWGGWSYLGRLLWERRKMEPGKLSSSETAAAPSLEVLYFSSNTGIAHQV